LDFATKKLLRTEWLVIEKDANSATGVEFSTGVQFNMYIIYFIDLRYLNSRDLSIVQPVWELTFILIDSHSKQKKQNYRELTKDLFLRLHVKSVA